jgi:hypothetical protein
MTNAARSMHPILSSTASVPAHVVYRTFVEETVVLNLETGKYHGLNVTGGRMLEALEREPDVATAAATLAEVYDRPVAEIEADLIEFCEGLLDRGLIEIDPPGE